MRAHVGDRIVLAAEHIDEPTRDGEVLEVRGADGGPPFVVRWADGHTGLIYPGPGSVLHLGVPGDEKAATPEPAPVPTSPEDRIADAPPPRVAGPCLVARVRGRHERHRRARRRPTGPPQCQGDEPPLRRRRGVASDRGRDRRRPRAAPPRGPARRRGGARHRGTHGRGGARRADVTDLRHIPATTAATSRARPERPHRAGPRAADRRPLVGQNGGLGASSRRVAASGRPMVVRRRRGGRPGRHTRAVRLMTRDPPRRRLVARRPSGPRLEVVSLEGAEPTRGGVPCRHGSVTASRWPRNTSVRARARASSGR